MWIEKGYTRITGTNGKAISISDINCNKHYNRTRRNSFLNWCIVGHRECHGDMLSMCA